MTKPHPIVGDMKRQGLVGGYKVPALMDEFIPVYKVNRHSLALPNK